MKHMRVNEGGGMMGMATENSQSQFNRSAGPPSSQYGGHETDMIDMQTTLG